MKKFPLPSLAGLLATLGLTACQDMGPTAVTDGRSPGTPKTALHGVVLLDAPPSARLRPASNGSAMIGPHGGSIEVDGARFVVPAGALREPVLITMHGKLNGQHRYRFGPNGLKFDVPATLTIPVDPAAAGVSADQLAVATAPDDTEDWRVIGGAYDSVAGAVSTPIHHFTQYALCVN